MARVSGGNSRRACPSRCDWADSAVEQILPPAADMRLRIMLGVNSLPCVGMMRIRARLLLELHRLKAT